MWCGTPVASVRNVNSLYTMHKADMNHTHIWSQQISRGTRVASVETQTACVSKRKKIVRHADDCMHQEALNVRNAA